MSEWSHRRVTPSQKHLLRVIRSFGAAGATTRQIALRAAHPRALEREATEMKQGGAASHNAQSAGLQQRDKEGTAWEQP